MESMESMDSAKLMEFVNSMHTLHCMESMDKIKQTFPQHQGSPLNASTYARAALLFYQPTYELVSTVGKRLHQLGTTKLPRM